jgi:hypothetical protein
MDSLQHHTSSVWDDGEERRRDADAFEVEGAGGGVGVPPSREGVWGKATPNERDGGEDGESGYVQEGDGDGVSCMCLPVLAWLVGMYDVTRD